MLAHFNVSKVSRFFANNSNSTSNIAKRKRKHRRTLRIEELEGREMLSATPFEVEPPIDSLNECVLAASACGATTHIYAPQADSANVIPFTPFQEANASIGTPLTQTEFNTIRAQYADLGLSSNMASYNIIVIDANQLSDTALRDAISASAQNDLTGSPSGTLVVLRTTSDR